MAVVADRTEAAVDFMAAEAAVDSTAVAEARTAVVAAAELIVAAQVAHIAAAAGAWVRRLRDVLAAARLAGVSATAQAAQLVLMPRLTASGIHSAARDLELDRRREAAVALAAPQAEREAREVPRMPTARGIRLVARAAPEPVAEHRAAHIRSHVPEPDREWPQPDIRSARLRADLVPAPDRVWAAVRPASRVEVLPLR
jgi:hypothetical protein